MARRLVFDVVETELAALDSVDCGGNKQEIAGTGPQDARRIAQIADAPWESPKEALYLAHSIRDSLIGGNSLKPQQEAVRHCALGIIDRMLGSATGELKHLRQEFSDPV